jgi:hypothetical protein
MIWRVLFKMPFLANVGSSETPKNVYTVSFLRYRATNYRRK